MMSELLQLTQRVDEQQSYFKTVEMKVVTKQFIQVNDHADQPIFKKNNFKYDKYELAIIIDFQEFQLLLRGFKNNDTFKNTLLWNKAARFMPLLLLFIIIPYIILIGEDTSYLVFMIWVICSFKILIFLLYILFYGIRVKNQLLKRLQAYCRTISQQQNDVNIQFVRQQIKQGWIQNFATSTAYFKVKSKRIQEDYTVVKLYKETGLNLLSSSFEEPIFTQGSFTFHKNRLQNIISFKQLELLFRSFKSNQAYQRTVFWNRCLISVLLTVFLSLVPILSHKQGDYNKYQLIISLSSFLVIILISFLIGCRISKIRLQLIPDFIDYCQNISRRHYKIEVIPHLEQSTIRRNCLKVDEIYCLEVKCKQLA